MVNHARLLKIEISDPTTDNEITLYSEDRIPDTINLDQRRKDNDFGEWFGLNATPTSPSQSALPTPRRLLRRYELRNRRERKLGLFWVRFSGSVLAKIVHGDPSNPTTTTQFAAASETVVTVGVHRRHRRSSPSSWSSPLPSESSSLPSFLASPSHRCLRLMERAFKTRKTGSSRFGFCSEN
ncbi:hypothetical protein Drorol1_Dr00021769 [Drosera rotundifolia]